MNVLDLIEQLKELDPDLPVVMLSSPDYGWDEIESVLSFELEHEGEDVRVICLSTIKELNSER